MLFSLLDTAWCAADVVGDRWSDFGGDRHSSGAAHLWITPGDFRTGNMGVFSQQKTFPQKTQTALMTGALLDDPCGI